MSQTDRFFSPRLLRRLGFRARRGAVSTLRCRIVHANRIYQHLFADERYVVRFGGLRLARLPKILHQHQVGAQLVNPVIEQGPAVGRDAQGHERLRSPGQFGDDGFLAGRRIKKENRVG